jgi:hypothetical protein
MFFFFFFSNIVQERLTKDKMHLHVNAYQQVQHVCTQMAFFEMKFATDILDKVAEPLLLFHKDLEGRLKRLITSEEKLENSIINLKNKVKNERNNCIKGWSELIKEYREWQKNLAAGDVKKIEKLEKSFLTRREKLRQQFIKFEQMIEMSNAEYKSYWAKELPAIVAAYEVLEVERCNELEARLCDFRTIQSEYSQPFPGMLSMVDQAVKGINGPRELKGFVDAVVAVAGKPEPPLAFVDGLPADSRALAESANQQTLGALLNQDPGALAAQRELLQLKSSGTVMGNETNYTLAGAGGLSASPAAISAATSNNGAAIANIQSATSNTPDSPSASAASANTTNHQSSSQSRVPAPPATQLPPTIAAVAASSSTSSQSNPPPFIPSSPIYAAAANAVAASSAHQHAAQTQSTAPATNSSSPPSSSNHTSSNTNSNSTAPSATASSAGPVITAADPFGRLSDPPLTFVRALYDFTSEDIDDLTFTLNTVIRVTLKGEDDELAAEVENGVADLNSEPRWWRGQRLENIGKSRDGTFPSNYVRICGVEKDMSLRHLLELPSGLRVFSSFLQAEYASENISFWMDVEKFRSKCLAFLVGAGTDGNSNNGELRDDGRAPMLAEAQRIATEYIGNSAANQINISSLTLKLTEERINLLPNSLSLNMFDDAASEVFKMLSADSFSRFKRSELFEKYLNTNMESAPAGHGQ